MMWGSGAGMWGWGLVWMVLFWSLLVVGVVWLVRAATGTDRPARGDGSEARRILDERFARGDLSAEEYAERRRALGGRS